MADTEEPRKPNDCCNVETNLVVIERRPVKYGADGSDAGELVIWRCRVCGCRHFVHEVKPFHLGLTLH